MKSKATPTKKTLDSTVAVIDEIRQALVSSRRVLVATHLDPDGDAIGTQLAFGAYLRDLGKDVVMLRDSAIPDKYLFLRGVSNIIPVREFDGQDGFDTVVVLECPSPDRLGQVRQLIGGETNVVNIDHHKDSTPFGSINWLDDSASSVGEMACIFFKQVGYEIRPEVAEQLYTAILTDTGRFRYDSTTSQTMCLAGELIDLGADPHKICDMVYFDLRPSTMKLLGKVLNGIEFHKNGRVCLMTLSRKMLEETKADEASAEGLVDNTMYSRGVVVGALLKETENGQTRVSLRSNNGIDVSAIARTFGGGGHFNASGCTLELELEQARSKVLEVLFVAVDGEGA